MSKGNTWETDLLKLVFQNIACTLVGDAAGLLPSAAPGNLYISLHTADPGEGGAQNTTEAAYGSYARVAVVRSAVGWTVASGACENAAAIDFPACTSGSETLTHFGIGTASTGGAGKLLYKGALSPNIAISTGITPSFAAGALDVTED